MTRLHERSFPGESDKYRQARNNLLIAEAELRRRVAEVAQQRSELPLGGQVAEEYRFEYGSDSSIGFSELFDGQHDTLILYSSMYESSDASPCPICTAFLDNLNGNAKHLEQNVALGVVAKAPISTLQAWAETRGWHNLRMLSAENCTYSRDYFGEDESGSQLPFLNVFLKRSDGIYHTYGSELLFVPNDMGDPRHVDMQWALWNLLDLTSTGRPEGWYPSLTYD